MIENFLPILGSGILIAVASGLIGSFLVLRKMTLLSDALSHVALPGIALGIVFNFQPIIGGLLFLFIAVLMIWGIENKTKLAIESITGVLFVTALAIGALLIPEHEILEAFFGDVQNISSFQIILQTIISLFIIFVTLKYIKPLVISSVAPDLAIADKISPVKMRLLLLSLIALTITIGISFVGILLMSALSIIPAVTARNLSKNFKTFMILSVLLSAGSLTIGLFTAQIYKINPGIATVLVSAFLFILSLFKQKSA